LLARERNDLEILGSSFPQQPDELLSTAANAVRDYLRTETDMERLQRVMASWTGAAREALREGDARGLRHAVAVLDDARAASPDESERAALFRQYRSRVPQGDVLREVVARLGGDEDRQAVADLLRPLGDASLAGLLDLLGEPLEVGQRNTVILLAADLAAGHLDLLAERVGDRRVTVARDALAVAYRVGGAGALPLLDRAARHASPEVRAEAARGLVAT